MLDFFLSNLLGTRILIALCFMAFIGICAIGQHFEDKAKAKKAAAKRAAQGTFVPTGATSGYWIK